jgi:ABC-type polar amino acid transport system ATPase subunit
MKQLADERMTMVIATHEIAFGRQVRTRLLFGVKDGCCMMGSPRGD